MVKDTGGAHGCIVAPRLYTALLNFAIASTVVLALQDAASGAPMETAASSTPTPVQKAATQQWAALLGGMLIGVVVLFTAWWAWWRWWRGREREQPRTPPQQPPASAWEEAGRRMEAGEPAFEGVTSPGDTRDPNSAHERLAVPIRTAHDHPPVAMVTGAARRVGRAIALELARVGFDIVLTYHKSYDEATALGREISALGRTVWLHELDLSQPGAVAALADELARTLPRLDVLVHNAAHYAPTPIDDVDVRDAIRMYEVNALGPLLLTARLRTLLAASTLKGGSCVVALSDIHAQGRPRRSYSGYLMSKAALDQLVQCLARDLAPAIRVNGVALGVVEWPQDGEESHLEGQKRYLRRVPLGRAGEPGDAAAAVRWLALEAPYVTGTTIRVDGGRWLG